MKLSTLLIALSLSAIAIPALAKTTEPDAVRRAERLAPGMGAVFLSVRGQFVSMKPISIWMEPADDRARATGTVLRFSHRGMGLGPLSRTLESDARVYAVPPGRWRLRAHALGCDEMPDQNSSCFISTVDGQGQRRGPSYYLPTGVYDAGWIEILVAPDRFLNAGEFILEAPPGTTVLGKMTIDEIRQRQAELEARNRALRVKWRPIPAGEAQLDPSFAKMPSGGSVAVSEEARSNVLCTTPPKKLKLRHHPFSC